MIRSTCALTLLTIATACGPKTGGASLARVQRLYAEGLDGAASRTATVMMRQRTQDADAAAWYGGLAEFRQGHDEQARRFFLEAARSGDAQIAGGAEAMLGQLDTRRNDLAASQRHFDRAWILLKGSDQRQVAIRGLAAARTAGDTLAKARWQERLGERTASDGSSDVEFALQAGAYRTRSSADAHASTLQNAAARAGLGPVQVRRRTDPQGTWWLVQCGDFATRAEASAARRRLPGERLIVARVSVE